MRTFYGYAQNTYSYSNDTTLKMAENRSRSTALCEGRTYTVYLRLSTIVSGCLTLVATTLALKETLHYQQNENHTALVTDEAESEIPANGFVHETLAFTVALMGTAAVTILLQLSLVLASKCSSYIYEPAQVAVVYLKLFEFLGSSVLLIALLASAIGEGVVVYHWALYQKQNRVSSAEALFKALSGSTAFGFLLALLLSLLSIMSFCHLRSLLKRPIHNNIVQSKTISAV